MRGRPNRDKPPAIQLLPPCGVCGLKAAGFHYGVTTCEACKGFFRRSLLRTRPYECVQTRQCHIGASTARRQSCPKCRYDKCISVGMSKDAIKTGRYSLLKKSKDIYELLQYQQSSTNETLDEELRIKAEQTLDKISRAKRRARAKYCGNIPRSSLTNTPQGELDLSSSPLLDHFTKGSDKITNPAPGNEIIHEVNNAVQKSFQPEAFLNPRPNHINRSSQENIKRETCLKSTPPVDDSYRYNLLSPPHRHEWNETLTVDADINSNPNSSGYQYPPFNYHCVQRYAGIFHNNVNVDHPPSYNQENTGSYHMREYQPTLHTSQRIVPLKASSSYYCNDGQNANRCGNQCIHSKENPGVERVSDTCHNLIGSMQMRDYRTLSHDTCLQAVESRRSAPRPAYSYRHEQDNFLNSMISSRNRSHFSKEEQTFLSTLSEPTMDYFSVQAETIPPHSQSFSNRSQHETSRVREELHDKQNVESNIFRFPYSRKEETDCANTKMPEVTFEKLIAQSIAGSDNWGGYGCYADEEKGDNCVDVDHIDTESTDLSFACGFDRKDVTSGYDVMNYKQEKDNHSSFKLEPDYFNENNHRLNSNSIESHQKMSSNKITAALPPGISDDIRFSILDMPRSIAGIDMFDLPFVEAFPYLSYERNLLKWILWNCSDSLLLERFAMLNPEGIKRAIRSIWQKGISDAIECSTRAENCLPQGCESSLCPVLSARSAFSVEILDGLSFSDYDTSDLENVISGLIKSHEAVIGLDSNCLSERQIQTAHNVFQGLWRLRQELLKPFKYVDSDIMKSPDIDLDGGRDTVWFYSLRSNENIPKVLMFYRSIPGFKQLSSRDKVTLVKGAIFEFMFLSSLRGVDHKRTTLVDGMNLITIDMSSLVFAFPVFGELCAAMQLVSREIKHMRLSKDILIVLKAISLMTPERPNLENPEKVKQMYRNLHACLQILLERQHGESGIVYHKIGGLFHIMRLAIEKFMAQPDENLKKLLEDTPVPLLKETMFHFMFD